MTTERITAAVEGASEAEALAAAETARLAEAERDRLAAETAQLGVAAAGAGAELARGEAAISLQRTTEELEQWRNRLGSMESSLGQIAERQNQLEQSIPAQVSSLENKILSAIASAQPTPTDEPTNNALPAKADGQKENHAPPKEKPKGVKNKSNWF